MWKPVSLVLAAGAASLALVACGGSAPSPRAFKHGFTQDKAQFSRLGADIGTAIATAAKRTNAALSTEFATLATRTSAQRAKLGQLHPPARYKAQLTAAIADLGKVAADLRAISAAAQTADGARAKSSAAQLVRDSLSFQSVERALSKQLGLAST